MGNIGHNIAHARQEIFSWGTKDDFYDGQNHRLGSVQKEVLRSMFGMGVCNRYSVLNAEGQVIGTSGKTQALPTDFSINDQSGRPIARIHRCLFNWFGDSWPVEVYQPGALDKRELALIAALKTHADNEKQAQKDSAQDKHSQ